MYETSKRRVKCLSLIFLDKSLVRLVIINFFAVGNDCPVIGDIFQSKDPRRDVGAN